MAGAGETPVEVGLKRAQQETGSFSYRNATIVEYKGQAADALIGYSIPGVPEPIGSEMPAMFVPL